MIQTASVTDLRFKTKDVLEKSKQMVWVFNHGKRVALIVDVTVADQLLQNTESAVSAYLREHPVNAATAILQKIKKHQVRGPKNLSQSIDKVMYG